jgi:ATP-dependent Clp protease adapter protein ClpS
MMCHILRLFFVAIALIATSVSSFVPADSRCKTPAFSRTSSAASTAAVKNEHRSPHNPFHPPSSSSPTTFLYSSPAPAIPATKEEKKVSKDAEKESKSSNSKGWAVRLYNDPMNKREFVARCLTEVCALSDGEAYQCMMKAHQFGLAVIGQYHLEMAELYRDQLTEHGLMIDMVPVDDDE